MIGTENPSNYFEKEKQAFLSLSIHHNGRSNKRHLTTTTKKPENSVLNPS